MDSPLFHGAICVLTIIALRSTLTHAVPDSPPGHGLVVSSLLSFNLGAIYNLGIAYPRKMKIEEPFGKRSPDVSHTSSDLSSRQTTSSATPLLRDDRFPGARHQKPLSIFQKAVRRIAPHLSNYRGRKKMQMIPDPTQVPASALMPEEELSPELQDCLAEVRTVFHDICPEYLRYLAVTHNTRPDKVINWIIDEQDQGRRYPKKQEPRTKRKRPPDSEDGSAAIDDDEVTKLLQKYDNPNRRVTTRSSRRADLV